MAADHFNAERFLAEHGEHVRFSPEIGRWLVWNGAHWIEDRLEAVQELGRQTIDRLRSWAGEASTEEEYKRRARHYGDSARVGRRDGMLTLARCDRSVVVATADLDRHRHLLACANGTVDLRTGELLDAQPDDLLTRGVDVDYDPEARSDEWEAFLATVFAGDDELVSFVRRLFGYATSGEISEHILPILHGTGANGKSTFVTALTEVLGDLAAVAPEGLLTESKHEQHPERLAALRGRRLVVSSELEHRAVLAEGLVKSITGGDRISARFLYGQRFEFEPTHCMVLVTNHAPKVRGTDEAIWRRLRLVPFAVTIAPADRVRDYGRRLAERHREAILAWLIAGAAEWYRDGLGDAERVSQATESYRRREDVFAQFLEERTIRVAGRTPLKQLHDAWREWSRTNGCAVGRSQDFSTWMGAHDVELTTVQGYRFAIGVGLLDESGREQAGVGPDEPSSVDRLAPAYTRAHAARARQFPDEVPRALTDAHPGEDPEQPPPDLTYPELDDEEQVGGMFDDDREPQPW